MGMIDVLEITLIVPTLRVGMPLRTLRVRSRMWLRCVDKLQRYPRHALGPLNSQSVPFVTRSVTGGMPTRSDGHDQCLTDLCITMSALRGNASQDAPRPFSNVAQMCGQAPALSMSCARLTGSAIRAICDAERHEMHAHAERWARSVLSRICERRVGTIIRGVLGMISGAGSAWRHNHRARHSR